MIKELREHILSYHLLFYKLFVMELALAADEASWWLILEDLLS